MYRAFWWEIQVSFIDIYIYPCIYTYIYIGVWDIYTRTYINIYTYVCIYIDIGLLCGNAALFCDRRRMSKGFFAEIWGSFTEISGSFTEICGSFAEIWGSYAEIPHSFATGAAKGLVKGLF